MRYSSEVGPDTPSTPDMEIKNYDRLMCLKCAHMKPMSFDNLAVPIIMQDDGKWGSRHSSTPGHVVAFVPHGWSPLELAEAVGAEVEPA